MSGVDATAIIDLLTTQAGGLESDLPSGVQSMLLLFGTAAATGAPSDETAVGGMIETTDGRPLSPGDTSTEVRITTWAGELSRKVLILGDSFLIWYGRVVGQGRITGIGVPGPNVTERRRYLRWVRGVPLTLAPKLHQLLIEYNPDGWAIREIGLDASDNVVHLYPSELHRWGDYGLLADGYPEIVEQPIAVGAAVEITAAEFESVWDRPLVEPPIVHQRHPGPDWPMRSGPGSPPSTGWRERLRRLRRPFS